MDLKQLLSQFGDDETGKINARAVKAFSNVMIWWIDELELAKQADDPDMHAFDAVNAMVNQMGIILGASFSDFPPEGKKQIIAHIISLIEMQAEGEDILPTREDIVDRGELFRNFDKLN